MKLILIKHARPLIDPKIPSHRWKLSQQGRADAAKLAEILRPMAIERLYSSDEPKAIETAEILAEALGITTSVADDLHEHDRSGVPHMRTGEFISHMELFFRRPDELVLGEESADECLARFASGIDALPKDQTTAIVSHGTVIALYLAQLDAGKPFEIWRKMGLPSYAVVHSGKVLEIVESIGADQRT
jgi:2,3-bisphosphoglycerate-dependent phosphoglycerate mutase